MVARVGPQAAQWLLRCEQPTPAPQLAPRNSRSTGKMRSKSASTRREVAQEWANAAEACSGVESLKLCRSSPRKRGPSTSRSIGFVALDSRLRGNERRLWLGLGK